MCFWWDQIFKDHGILDLTIILYHMSLLDIWPSYYSLIKSLKIYHDAVIKNEAPLLTNFSMLCDGVSVDFQYIQTRLFVGKGDLCNTKAHSIYINNNRTVKHTDELLNFRLCFFASWFLVFFQAENRLTFTCPCFWIHSPAHVGPTGPILFKEEKTCLSLSRPRGSYRTHASQRQKHAYTCPDHVKPIGPYNKLLGEESILHVWSILKIS